MLNLDWTPIPVFVLAIGSLPFGIGGFYTIMLPFTLDQMIGASAEELSAAVQWYWWGFNVLLLNVDTLSCILIHLRFQYTIPACGFPHLGFSEFISCSDNGLSVPHG